MTTKNLKDYEAMEAEYLACMEADPKRADELDRKLLALWLRLEKDELAALDARHPSILASKLKRWKIQRQR